jgi:hypothetical protein
MASVVSQEMKISQKFFPVVLNAIALTVAAIFLLAAQIATVPVEVVICQVVPLAANVILWMEKSATCQFVAYDVDVPLEDATCPHAALIAYAPREDATCPHAAMIANVTEETVTCPHAAVIANVPKETVTCPHAVITANVPEETVTCPHALQTAEDQEHPHIWAWSLWWSSPLVPRFGM